jgi:hypothetical protein
MLQRIDGKGKSNARNTAFGCQHLAFSLIVQELQPSFQPASNVNALWENIRIFNARAES